MCRWVFDLFELRQRSRRPGFRRLHCLGLLGRDLITQGRAPLSGFSAITFSRILFIASICISSYGLL